MTQLTQENRDIGIGTPLGDDKLLLRAFHVTEQLGRIPQISADLLSTDYEIDFETIVGHNVTIRMSLANDKIRYFNGYVSSFSQVAPLGQLARYQATIVPWLWFLTRTADCQIFQNMAIPDIIAQVFSDHGFADFENRLKGTYDPWEYCVQYRETDFNFVSRLMEQEGIYYFFTHDNGKHTLILADDPTCHDPYDDYEEIVFRPPTPGHVSSDEISSWVRQQAVQPGTYALNDFNFEKPTDPLDAAVSIQRPSANSHFEIYDYPGEYIVADDGNEYAKIRINELQAQYEVIHGGGDARGMGAGWLFTLQEHPRADQNIQVLVTSVHYSVGDEDYEAGASGEGSGLSYSCNFTAIDATQEYRPPRITPKPIVQGPQTAIVVGPSGEEIYADEYGRVKVKFHWDRYSNADENSSCWIRVAQVWAGKQWGGLYTPRIGQEVIIEFLEGDPDQPIITGRVYNGDAMPPYNPKEQPTVSTLMSLSSKGGGGFNEFRIEDLAGSEKIFTHAEKDQDIRVKNDRKEWIGNDRHRIVINNELAKVGADQHLTVVGDRDTAIQSNDNLKVTADQHIQVDGGRSLNVTGDQKQNVGGNQNLNVGSNINEQAGATISLQAGSNVYIKGGSDQGYEAGQNFHIKGGMNVVIEAGTSLTIKAGGSFVVLDASGVSISGTMVNLNSGGSPGSGDGCSPTDPDAPDAPDAPQDPLEAVDSQAGDVTEIDATADEKSPDADLEDVEVSPADYSPAAQVMAQAADDGTPFCAKCEAAKAAQAAQADQDDDDDQDDQGDRGDDVDQDDQSDDDDPASQDDQGSQGSNQGGVGSDDASSAD